MTAPEKRINSRAKGIRGELQFAKALTEAGYPAERGQQRAGGQDSPDVRCPSLSWIHWEVKRTATCQLFAPAMVSHWEAQARRDAGPGLPVLAHRWDGQKKWWLRVLPPAPLPAVWLTLPEFLASLPAWKQAHVD